MKRRRNAAFHKAWRSAMESVLDRVEALATKGLVGREAANELRAVCNRPPPALEEGPVAPQATPKSPWLAVPKRSTP